MMKVGKQDVCDECGRARAMILLADAEQARSST